MFFIGIVTTPNRKHYLDQLLESIEQTKNRDFAHHVHVEIDTKQLGVHAMRNRLLLAAQKTDYKFGFLLDDDIFFIRKGWDILYYVHAVTTGYHHLSYYNPNWIKSPHKPPLNVFQTQGCLHTFTPKVLDAVGYYDVKNMGRRGVGHWDWSARACRAGFNNANDFQDMPNSMLYVDMQIDNYTPAWDKPPKENMQQKILIAKRPGRIYVGL